ncbi:MAG TPA: hypothetical protein VGQ90_07665 [Stellaceae bacterium]|nr:hypothetical protein [Stellaceae bacterium]
MSENLLALRQGFTLTGPVAASGTANTLGLLGSAGAPVTVDYNGLGLMNFQNIPFGPDNNATLELSNTSGTLGVRISGFDAASEIIDLRGIGTDGTIINTDTTNDRLTIAGSSGTVTLQFDNIDSTIFVTAPDAGTLDAPPADTLLLRSLSAVPSLVGLNRHEHRRLGVAVRQIILWQPGVVTIFDHDAPLFADGGCHAPESGHSWTDGELSLPTPLVAHLKGAFTLVVHTSRQTMRYPISDEVPRAA